MRVRLAKKTSKPQRGGFTLIELLVVISIIAVLAALILPGVQNAREAARRIQCMNNMRNIGLAVINYSTNNNGSIPPLAGGVDYFTGDSATPKAPAPWTVHLLPFLDNTPLYEELVSSGRNAGNHATQTLKVYICPNDPTSNSGGAFSYAANAGYIPGSSFNGTTDHTIGGIAWRVRDSAGTPSVIPNTQLAARAKISLASGMFWKLNTTAQPTTNDAAANLKMSLDMVRDGASQTLLLTENMSNDGWLPSSANSYQTSVRDFGFGTMIASNNAAAPIGSRVLGTQASDYGLDGLMDSTTANSDEKRSRINQDLLTAQGSRPRPSSYHPLVVNVVFCDGSARPLSQSVSDNVLIRLVSPNGAALGQPTMSENDF